MKKQHTASQLARDLDPSGSGGTVPRSASQLARDLDLLLNDPGRNTSSDKAITAIFWLQRITPDWADVFEQPDTLSDSPVFGLDIRTDKSCLFFHRIFFQIEQKDSSFLRWLATSLGANGGERMNGWIGYQFPSGKFFTDYILEADEGSHKWFVGPDTLFYLLEHMEKSGRSDPDFQAGMARAALALANMISAGHRLIDINKTVDALGCVRRCLDKKTWENMESRLWCGKLFHGPYASPHATTVYAHALQEFGYSVMEKSSLLGEPLDADTAVPVWKDLFRIHCSGQKSIAMIRELLAWETTSEALKKEDPSEERGRLEKIARAQDKLEEMVKNEGCFRSAIPGGKQHKDGEGVVRKAVLSDACDRWGAGALMSTLRFRSDLLEDRTAIRVVSGEDDTTPRCVRQRILDGVKKQLTQTDAMGFTPLFWSYFTHSKETKTFVPCFDEKQDILQAKISRTPLQVFVTQAMDKVGIDKEERFLEQGKRGFAWSLWHCGSGIRSVLGDEALTEENFARVMLGILNDFGSQGIFGDDRQQMQWAARIDSFLKEVADTWRSVSETEGSAKSSFREMLEEKSSRYGDIRLLVDCYVDVRTRFGEALISHVLDNQPPVGSQQSQQSFRPVRLRNKTIVGAKAPFFESCEEVSGEQNPGTGDVWEAIDGNLGKGLRDRLLGLSMLFHAMPGEEKQDIHQQNKGKELLRMPYLLGSKGSTVESFRASVAGKFPDKPTDDLLFLLSEATPWLSFEDVEIPKIYGNFSGAKSMDEVNDFFSNFSKSVQRKWRAAMESHLMYREHARVVEEDGKPSSKRKISSMRM